MPQNWIKVATTDQVEEDDLIQVKVEDNLIAIYNVGGKFFATSDICTHEYACLSDGFVIDGQIECPLHQGCFDIKTGKAQGAPVTIDLKTYQVRVEGDDISVFLD